MRTQRILCALQDFLRPAFRPSPKRSPGGGARSVRRGARNTPPLLSPPHARKPASHPTEHAHGGATSTPGLTPPSARVPDPCRALAAWGWAAGLLLLLALPASAQDIPKAMVRCAQCLAEDYDGLVLSYPNRVNVDPVRREVYVTDSGHGRIVVYTHDFFPLLSIGRADGVVAPSGLAVDAEGYLFVAQRPSKEERRARITVLDPALGRVRDIFFSGFRGAETFEPRALALGAGGELYVAGAEHRGLLVLDRQGNYLRQIRPEDHLGKQAPEKALVCDVAVGPSGALYLLSEEMGRVYVYDAQERPVRRMGAKGGGPGKLSRPRGLAVDEAEGRLYVIDYMRHTANAYSLEGELLFEFGGKGVVRGWFQFPNDIAVDPAGNVLVADTFNNRVQVLLVRESEGDDDLLGVRP